MNIGGDSWANEQLTYTLPEEYTPGIEVTAPLVTANGASTTGYVRVQTDGKIIVGNYGGTGSTDVRQGFVMYPKDF